MHHHAICESTTGNCSKLPPVHRSQLSAFEDVTRIHIERRGARFVRPCRRSLLERRRAPRLVCRAHHRAGLFDHGCGAGRAAGFLSRSASNFLKSSRSRSGSRSVSLRRVLRIIPARLHGLLEQFHRPVGVLFLLVCDLGAGQRIDAGEVVPLAGVPSSGSWSARRPRPPPRGPFRS